jgi:hypothetical protein
VNGSQFFGTPGTAGSAGTGTGGGLDLMATGTAKIDNTTIASHHASSTNDDVFGTFSP